MPKRRRDCRRPGIRGLFLLLVELSSLPPGVRFRLWRKFEILPKLNPLQCFFLFRHLLDVLSDQANHFANFVAGAAAFHVTANPSATAAIAKSLAYLCSTTRASPKNCASD